MPCLAAPAYPQHQAIERAYGQAARSQDALAATVSYVAINTPVLVVLLSTSRSDACVPPANSRRPVPSTKGTIISRYSSIKSAAISEPISTPLPMITRFALELSLRSATAAGTSPCSRVEFGHSSLALGLLEATYLRASLSASLNGPPRAFQDPSSCS